MVKMLLIITLVVLVTLATKSTSDTKVWTKTSAIDNPKNWIDGKVQTKCEGLVFAKFNTIQPVFIKYLNIKQLVLPWSGKIALEEGSTVVFDEDSTDVLNCVRLKPYGGYYWHTNFWKNLDNPDNPAVPYSEQLPCKYDDVVLPHGFNASIVVADQSIRVKSVTFGKEKVTQEEMNDLVRAEAGIEALYLYQSDERIPIFQIKEQVCSDPTGCDRRASLPKIYQRYIHPTTLQCSDSIDIIGNINQPICGAQILIKTLKKGFTIDKINRKLKEYKSYTHASKYEPENHIQIIFTEKEFTGLSLWEATEFYNVLREDYSYFSEDITLATSGLPPDENKLTWKNAFSIIFGTLVGAILIFGLVFLVYSPTVANLNLRNRLRSARPLSTYILRYDNIDDRADIIDGQSMAGSVLALNRAFENPLYDHAPSTRSTSNETVMSPKLEEDDYSQSDTAFVVDSAKELEDIDLHNEDASSKNDNLLLKDL